MSNLGISIIVVVVLAFFGGCSLLVVSCEKIDPGHVGVSVKKCGGGGVEEKPIPTGFYWKHPFCEDVIETPTNIRILSLGRIKGKDDSITVSSQEGLPINIDITLSFSVDPKMAPAIYQKYRAPVDRIASTFIRQSVREGLQLTFAKYTAEQIYSERKEAARSEVQSFLGERLLPEGFIISQFTLNDVRVPEQVTNAINAKVTMIQEAKKAEQEVLKTRALAEQAKVRAEGEAQALRTRADAEAYANKTIAASLTAEYIQYKYMEKWNGAVPQVQAGSSVLPLVQVK